MKKIKKLFFYILWTSISFLSVFGKQSEAFSWNSLWPKERTFIDILLDTLEYVFFLWFITSLIIFLIWLYFYLTKKDIKDRKKRWLKYIKISIILFIVIFLLWNLATLFFKIHYVYVY